MFNGRTVFVLGAGASYDYGFPLGSELKEKIINLLKISLNDWGGIDGKTDANVFFSSITTHKVWGIDQRIFSDAAQIIRKGLPGKLSIDEFIGLRNKEVNVTKLAKLAIAYLITKAEKDSKLMLNERTANFNMLAEDGSWYHKFWHFLSEGIIGENIYRIFDETINPVTIITFNYDRSLEHFLFHMIMNTYGISPDKTALIMQKFNIHHVYGSLGKLDESGHSTNAGLSFGHIKNIFYKMPGHNDLLLQEAAQLIKTYTEEIDDIDSIITMRASISRAEKLFFIGFGYHLQNMNLLFSEGKVEKLYCKGTGCGIKTTTRSRISDAIRQKIKVQEVGYDIIDDTDAYNFMLENEYRMKQYMIVSKSLSIKETVEAI